MATHPAITPVQSLQLEIDDARGQAADEVGQSYNVYRLKPNSSGSIISPRSLVIANFPAKMEKNTKSIANEQSMVYEMLFEGMCDRNQLQLGDVLDEIGFRSDTGMYVLADARPLKPYMFVRVEILGGITRQASDQVGPEPTLGRGQYQGTSKSLEWISQLTNGLYSFVQSGTPAGIPMGIQMHRRMGKPAPVKIPTGSNLEEVFCYVPLLPGLTIQPTDVLSDQNGNRYEIHSVQVFTAGLEGWFIVGHKLLV